MAGGTFLVQNKVRPGAYINFKGIPKPLATLGARGVVTLPLEMDWGAEVIELLSTELLDGKSVEKIGYSAFDEVNGQIYREALKNAYKAIIFRLNMDGNKAAKTLGNLTVTALYPGIAGNEIMITIIEDEENSRFEVVTLYKGLEKDRQIGEVVEDLEDNKWVKFTGTGALATDAGTKLEGGTNGTYTNERYSDYLDALKPYKWNTMGIPHDVPTAVPNIITYIKKMRDESGRKVQAVLYDAAADHEGIITCNQGYKTNTEEISETTFIAYLAGLTAGSDVNTSNTYHAIEGAVSIIYKNNEPLDDEEIEKALKAGKLVLSTRQDGVIIIEQDINSLHEFTPTKGYTFSKNRVIRTLDEINNSISLVFEKSYIGKVDNNDEGRNIFKGDVINYLNMLQDINAIQNFDADKDIEVLPGQAIDAVVVNLAIQPVDSMEKLYMTVNVG